MKHGADRIAEEAEEKESLERARKEMLIKKKAAREKKLKQQQQQQSVPKPKIDTHNKWASKHVIRKPREKKCMKLMVKRETDCGKKADVEASDSERPKYQRHNEAPSDG